MKSRGPRFNLAAATTAAAVGLFALGGCVTTDGPAYVSDHLTEYDLPALAHDPLLAAVADWKTLEDPSEEIREAWAMKGSTYRVASATRNSVHLVVWKTDATGPEPFNANRVATGFACVHLQRRPAGISAQVEDCPESVPESAESGYTSWGRDADAVAETYIVQDLADSEVSWLMHHVEGGMPRTTSPDASLIIDAVRRVVREPHVDASLEEVLVNGQTLSATLDVTATAPDAIDPAASQRARTCFAMKVELDLSEANGYFSPTPCP